MQHVPNSSDTLLMVDYPQLVAFQTNGDPGSDRGMDLASVKPGSPATATINGVMRQAIRGIAPTHGNARRSPYGAALSDGSVPLLGVTNVLYCDGSARSVEVAQAQITLTADPGRREVLNDSTSNGNVKAGNLCVIEGTAPRSHDAAVSERRALGTGDVCGRAGHTMSIRDTFKRRPGVAAAVAIGLFVAAGAVLVVWANTRREPQRVTRVFYSTADGNTFFADDVNRIYPFDHNGKPAYRAYVYRCGKGDPFVSYLARYTDAAHARLTQLSGTSTDPDAAAELAQLRSTGVEVKRPGDTEWVPLFSAAGEEITRHPPCPEGGRAVPVEPAAGRPGSVRRRSGRPVRPSRPHRPRLRRRRRPRARRSTEFTSGRPAGDERHGPP